MGNHQAGDAVVCHNLFGEFQHLFGGGRVESGGVFVQQQQLGCDHGCHEQGQRLPLTAGEQSHGMIHPIFQTKS